MKKSILITTLLGTALLLGADLPTSIKVAERNHAENVKKIKKRAEENIKKSEDILIKKLKYDLNRQMQRNSLDNIMILKEKIDKLTKCKADFLVEGVSQASAIDLQDGKKPWSNRDYAFINLPKNIAGMKFYQYEARSRKGVKLRVNKKGIVKIIVGGWEGDLPGLKQWEKEG